MRYAETPARREAFVFVLLPKMFSFGLSTCSCEGWDDPLRDGDKLFLSVFIARNAEMCQKPLCDVAASSDSVDGSVYIWWKFVPHGRNHTYDPSSPDRSLVLKTKGVIPGPTTMKMMITTTAWMKLDDDGVDQDDDCVDDDDDDDEVVPVVESGYLLVRVSFDDG
mmetsp:Transcript_34252/g.50839  ORF Transcript_34252/g.50839 Transcript_34252/m.50839 type:complete len:165 (-) Transcript_34252:85-579(-)